VKKAHGQASEKGKRPRPSLTTETKAASDCSINRRKLSFSTTPWAFHALADVRVPNDGHWARSKTHHLLILFRVRAGAQGRQQGRSYCGDAKQRFVLWSRHRTALL